MRPVGKGPASVRGKAALLCAMGASSLLAGCGGGSEGQVQSTPPPVSAPTPTPTASPTPTPTSANDYDTAEYRASSGPVFHGALAAYEAGASGAGVTVGIVDSGIADVDGEFTGRISPLSRDFAGNGSVTDVGGHGTAVAEVLAGGRNDEHVEGMAWGATILALRTDQPGSCAGSGCQHPASAIAQAIDYAWRSGARVINISLGGDINSSDVLAAVSRATSAGTIIVVAAGNAKSGEAPSASPDLLAASIANPVYSHGLVIVATSVGADGLVSSFSDGARGFETSTLSALGDSVRTIDNHGTDLLYTGTSFSAPQIAGAAALLAQAFPNLTSAQIVQLLLNTARDAGATGPDALYGMGILDVARAFEPQGSLSLAGSTVTMSLGDVTTLSGPMGDARPAALGAVVLDAYRRPYRTDLSASVQRAALQDRLTASLASGGRQIDGMAGPLTFAFSIAPGHSGALMLSGADQAGARFLSGTIGARLSGTATMAFGLRTSLRDLSHSLDGARRPAFLMADDGAGTLANELRPQSSIAWRQVLGHGFALTSGVEMGGIDSEAPRPGLIDSAPGTRAASYQSMLSAVSFDRGRLGLTAGVRLVDEQGSALGARFAPALGAQSARSLFASLDIRWRTVAGVTFDASIQQGWTYADAGGALTDGGLFKSRSWSLDLARGGTFAKGDMIGLRIAAPLRVTASRFALDLPTDWDWKSQTATMVLTPLDLVPQGSERDIELSYGVGIVGGWLSGNLFMRAQPGNIANMPDDRGGAVRWNVRL